MEHSAAPTTPGFRAQLSLWDGVSIIIGIVVGAGIYETPPSVFRSVPNPWIGLAVWVVAGLLCLIGALCYAELATTYPRIGGDYVYLTRAYGAPVGFLYGWTQLAAIQTTNIGMMAFVFGDYAVRLWDLEGGAVYLALLAVIALSLVNVLGIVLGKSTQNVLTIAKVLGLGAILVAGVFWGQPSLTTSSATPPMSIMFPARRWFPLVFYGALVPVFFTYGGWNDAAFVAAELRNGKRNIPLALILGTGGVIVIYLLVNGAYLLGLGFEGASNSRTIAADVFQLPLSHWSSEAADWSSKAMCILVMISALGAVNGLIFTSSRIYAALGADHSIFAGLSRWHPRWGSPIWSLITQAAITAIMILTVGSVIGQQTLKELFLRAGLGEVSWEGQSGFASLLKCSAPVFWFFFLLSSLSLFVLRYKDRGKERPFSVPLFPVVPLIFVATCGFMLYSGIQYAKELGLVGGGLLLAGIPLWLISRTRRNIHAPQPISAAGLVGASSLDLPDSRIHPDSEQPSPGPGGESQDAG
jgi:APA family basic amino acid/polyamine antiporter